ncbi:MAG TPA: hypothetical protein EYN28_07760 [Flavobacteriales bacterium]|jgi:endonuclease/exonuclease/phosphatase family metal-dependent hydrolase|nr:hypothetical protein [Flavobacteriales bacterium]HIN41197.1 hypothetical protein [Flavobacteriales bacterium]HIO16553.1 hypothetical protein [Flavobacteriales bacterium]HIO60056.1 hypothetical protein [Flavobacteriales bacterium]
MAKWDEKKNKRFRLDRLLVAPAGALLVGAKLAEVISPEVVSIFAVFGLVFPIVLLVFFVGIAMRMLRGGIKELVWPVILLIWIQPNISSTIGGWGTSPDFSQSLQELSIATYNVRRMDEYEWLEGDKTRDEILEWLGDNRFDVMCFQEFPPAMKNKVSKAIGGAEVMMVGSGAGPATATSLTVLNVEKWVAPGETHPRGIITDVISAVGHDTIRIFNVHLQSVGFARNDYDAVREGPDAEQSKKLWARLSTAYSKRASQAKAVRETVEKSPFPIVLLGDFNDTPVSFTLSKLCASGASELTDSYTSAGEGLGATYVGDIPWLRIDYILNSNNFKTKSFTTHQVKLSDHRPISATLVY